MADLIPEIVAYLSREDELRQQLHRIKSCQLTVLKSTTSFKLVMHQIATEVIHTWYIDNIVRFSSLGPN